MRRFSPPPFPSFHLFSPPLFATVFIAARCRARQRPWPSRLRARPMAATPSLRGPPAYPFPLLPRRLPSRPPGQARPRRPVRPAGRACPNTRPLACPRAKPHRHCPCAGVRRLPRHGSAAGADAPAFSAPPLRLRARPTAATPSLRGPPARPFPLPPRRLPSRPPGQAQPRRPARPAGRACPNTRPLACPRAKPHRHCTCAGVRRPPPQACKLARGAALAARPCTAPTAQERLHQPIAGADRGIHPRRPWPDRCKRKRRALALPAHPCGCRCASPLAGPGGAKQKLPSSQVPIQGQL